MTRLIQPIQRGETVIAEVAVRKPDTGAMRGLKLTDVLQMDVNSMVRLLPRVTEPALMPSEVEALQLPDLLALSSEVVGFFMTAEQIRQERATLQ